MPGSLLEPIRQKSEQSKSNLTPFSSTCSSSTSSPSPLPSLTSNQNINNSYNRHPHHHRHHPTSSARSDRSDGSAYSSEGGGSSSATSKKVSFNKAVRVKKYSSPPTQSGDLSESKFWFKVHKASSDHLNNNNSNSQQLKTVNSKSNASSEENNINSHHLQNQQQRHQLTEDNLIDSSLASVDDRLAGDYCSSQLSGYFNSLPTDNCNNGQPRSLSTIIESDLKSSTSSLLLLPGSTATPINMAPISNRKENEVKIIDYSVDQGTLGRRGDSKSMKGSNIDNKSPSPLHDTSTATKTGSTATTAPNKSRRVINYEPHKSASTIALDIDSSLRPRSPSPVTKNGRNLSVDSASRTIANKNNSSTIRPGSAASEEIIETKVIEKKSPLFSGVKVMFGVKAKRAPTFPTMPNRSKSVDRTNSTVTTIKPTTSSATAKSSATIVRPTFASRTTSSALKAKDSTNINTTRSRLSETSSPTKASFISSRSTPLTSNLKKTATTSTTATKNVPSYSSSREVSQTRASAKSPSLVSNEISKLMSTVSTKKQDTPGEVESIKSNNEIDGGEGNVVEMSRERSADQSTGDLIPVATWSSGPVLIANVANKEVTSSYIPGEGKLMATFEEGTKTWKSKTRRVYEEPIKIPRDKSGSPERVQERKSPSPERLAIDTDKSVKRGKSKSPDRESTSSRTHSPNRQNYRSHDRSAEQSSTKERSVSPKSDRHRARHDSPERSPSSCGYRSPTRQRPLSPFKIERQLPVSVANEDTLDGEMKKSTRTRFSPTPEEFYRSTNDDDENGKSMPTGDDLDDIFLRKDVYPNGREPSHNIPDDDDLMIDYVPMMEDKACQCNLKRSSRSKGAIDSSSGIGYRVIKPATDGSVSTFSNVPDISDEEIELDTRRTNHHRSSPRSVSRDPSPSDRRLESVQSNAKNADHHRQHQPHSEVIYSQIDRTKKRPNQTTSPSPENDEHRFPNYPSDDHELRHHHHHTHHDSVDRPIEYGPDDYLYESNAIKAARSSVSPVPEHEDSHHGRRSMESSHHRRQLSSSPSPSRRYVLEFERKAKPESSLTSTKQPNKTVSVTHKTYGFNMKTALDAPEVHLPVRPPSTKPVRVIEAPYHHHQYPDETLSRGERLDNHHHSQQQHVPLQRSLREDPSVDELCQVRRGSLSDPDDLLAPKSIVREIDHRKGEINYENVTPGSRHRSSHGMRNSIYEDHLDGQSNAMWFRSLDDDYRKGMSDREAISYHNGNHDLSDHNVTTDYCTMSRRGRNRSTPREVDDYSPAAMGHAYTLDRRHLDRAKRSSRPGSGYPVSSLGISSPTMTMSMNGGLGTGLTSKSTPSANHSMTMRKYNSTRDLSHLNPNDFSDIGSTRGGLAAAYKARQRRASSLSRYGQPGYQHIPPSSSSPHHYRTSQSVLSTPAYPLYSGSHSQLHRLHLSGSESGYPNHYHHHHPTSHYPLPRSSASHIGASYGHSSSESDAGLGSHHRSLGGSRTRLHHQNDPVVLYIPAISHHHRPVDEDDRNSALGIARTQSILSSSKRSVKSGLSTKSNKKRDPSKERDANFNEITSKVNGYINNNNNNNNNNLKDKNNQITSSAGLDGDEDEIIELRDDDDNNNNKISGKKKDVKRSVSIPKDTKLPWLQKLKMKVKS